LLLDTDLQSLLYRKYNPKLHFIFQKVEQLPQKFIKSPESVSYFLTDNFFLPRNLAREMSNQNREEAILSNGGGGDRWAM